MARKSQPQPLTLAQPSPTLINQEQDYLDSPRSPSIKSPKSPNSLFRFTTKKPQSKGEQPPMHPADASRPRTDLPQSQTLPALSQYRGAEDKQEREKSAKGGFFSNYKATKSQHRLDQGSKPSEGNMSRDTEAPVIPGKAPLQESFSNMPRVEKTITRRPVGGPARSDVSLASTTADTTPSTSSDANNKKKPKPFSLLSRTKSIRGDEQSPRDSSPNNKKSGQEKERTHAHKDSLKSAPLRAENDRSFRDMMNSTMRQHSADRVTTRARNMSGSREPKETGRQPTSLSNSFRETGGGFLNNLKSTATKGAGAISKGIFGKSSRSGSTIEREPAVDDEHYVLKVINKSLVEQTRKTRISKRLEDSKDKTEFWMPSLPWRAIDYLNYKGSEVEGLYRVPGSSAEIKKWQRRFDEEHDVDLFAQEDLYDINIIGSMLKAWLRELPDELLPKAAQDRIKSQCSSDNNDDKVPQILIDELSNLPPFNYYLLFAITCHLSLLLTHSDKNKMDYRNLCICFQPCMKMDALSFKFLVCNWRDCWKTSQCLDEGRYTDEEYRLFEQDMRPPNSAEGRSSTAIESHDERNVSSSDSSKPSSVSVNEHKWNQGQQNKKLQLSHTHASVSTVNTQLTIVQETTPPRKANNSGYQLSPVKPLSPIGLLANHQEESMTPVPSDFRLS